MYASLSTHCDPIMSLIARTSFEWLSKFLFSTPTIRMWLPSMCINDQNFSGSDGGLELAAFLSPRRYYRCSTQIPLIILRLPHEVFRMMHPSKWGKSMVRRGAVKVPSTSEVHFHKSLLEGWGYKDGRRRLQGYLL